MPLTSLSGMLTPIGTVGTDITTSLQPITGASGIGAGAGAAGLGTMGLLTSAFGIAAPIVSTIMSISEAQKAADARRAAQKAAEDAAAEQKRLLQQNFYEALRVPTEAYDRAFREGTAANQQAIQALAQDPRMLLGGIQGVQEATIEGQAKSREALADRLYNLDVMKAGAATQQAQNLAKISEQEALGAQVAAMSAEKAKIAQQQAAMQGAGNLITQGAGMVGTYGGLATPEDKLALANLKSSLGESFSKPTAQQSGFASLLQGATPEQLQSIMQILNPKV